MKILRYILLASLTCALSACEKDEILPEPEPPVVTPGDDPGKDEEEKIRLGITASLQAMQTKGIIEAFLPGHEMGVFISTTDTGSPYVYNVPYAFDAFKIINVSDEEIYSSFAKSNTRLVMLSSSSESASCN